MKAIKKTLAVATLVAAAPMAAQAAEVSGNVTFATDYTFRGISQTDEKFALQGGFDVAFDSGFYVGTWASNVDFGPNDADDSGAQAELDLYFGYAFDLAENVSLDLGYIYFVYPGDEAALNYQEFVATLSISDLSLGVVYSNEYFGDDGPDAYVLNADYSFSLAEDLSLDLHVGYSDADEDDFFGGDDDSYLDWSVGLTKSYAGLDFTLAYVDTDLDEDVAGDIVEGRAVFSISKSL